LLISSYFYIKIYGMISKVMQLESLSIFKRLEIKFVLTPKQYADIYDIIKQNIPQDKFGEYFVQSVYFDTTNWDVVRASIEKPVYKEKLRLRCYNVSDVNSIIFLELKKKMHGVVYKRRISFPMSELHSKTVRDIVAQENCQISRELSFYLDTNPVSEKAHVSYRRLAFADTIGLRVTFDSNIRFRTELLDYSHPEGGLPILKDKLVVMEIKTLGGMPMWLANALSAYNIFPTSFSKYGMGYKQRVLKKIK